MIMTELQITAIKAIYHSIVASNHLHYIDFAILIEGELINFYGILHQCEGLLIIELEPAALREETSFVSDDFELIRTFISKIKKVNVMVEASQIAADEIKRWTGYDRVMIYEFDEIWNGKVIAEAKEIGLEPFLSHHYPATDIPKQARELYLRNWLRTIVDVHCRPVEIIPMLNPITDKPLNLSMSILRSVSPIHIEYLMNMGVGATMTISLIHEG